MADKKRDIQKQLQKISGMAERQHRRFQKEHERLVGLAGQDIRDHGNLLEAVGWCLEQYESVGIELLHQGAQLMMKA